MNPLRRFALVTSLCALLFAPAPALAAPITFLQFTQAALGNNFGVATNGVTSQISSTQTVNVIFDPGFCLVPGCGGATNGLYTLSLNATSTGPATLVGLPGSQDINQNFAGVISLTQGGLNLLTVNFTDLFSGALGGSSPTLAASQPPDLFSGSSDVFDPLKLGTPRGFALSFSSFACLGGGGLATTGASICGGSAAGTGTFSAEPAAVPEPGTLALFGIGLLGAARKVRRYTRG